MAKTTGQVISGSFDSIVVRQKSDAKLEIGQLLTAQTSQGKVLLQVFDLVYGSQLSQQNLEMISGMKLESDNDLELMDAELRNYTLAFLKPLLLLKHGTLRVCKTLPDFFLMSILNFSLVFGFIPQIGMKYTQNGVVGPYLWLSLVTINMAYSMAMIIYYDMKISKMLR